MRKSVFRASDQSNTNQAVLLQKMARGLKFWIEEEEGLYYLNLCSENKGDDQQHSNCGADLRLCFCTCKKEDFFMTWPKHCSNIPI